MAFREVSVVTVREILRLWLAGHGYRSIARLGLVDRRTARRYVIAAVVAGLDRQGGEAQLTEELLAEVAAAVPSGRPPGDRGPTWQILMQHKAFIAERLAKGLTLVRVQSDLARYGGVDVPYRTLHRFCAAEWEMPAKRTTVRIDDPDPGSELQVDFGRMGLLHDREAGRRRVVHALIFTAAYSRHTFVHLTFSQALPAVIEGFEAAWAFFGGVFKVIIPDNLKAVVDRSDPIDPKLNEAFLEYAQARGFIIDPARARHPRDKARCEQAPALLPAPESPYDLPIYSEPKVARDYHVEVAKALYSVPAAYIGCRVKARADRHLVRIYHRGVLVTTHPRKPPGRRSTHQGDLPPEKAAYAMRDVNRLKGQAAAHGPSVGALAAAVLEGPLPWTRMRRVYRLLGLVRRFGAERVEAACARAVEFEAYDVGLVARMVEKARERQDLPAPWQASGEVVQLRFARLDEEFAASKGKAR